MDDAAVLSLGNLSHGHRLLVIVWAEDEDVGWFPRIAGLGRHLVIDNQVARSRVVGSSCFAGLGMRKQIPEQVHPEAVEAVPRNPLLGPTALCVGGENGGSAKSRLPYGK